MKTKQCTKCKEVKPLSDFSKDKHKKDGYTIWCKKCVAAYYRGHREEVHDRYLQRRYNITLREYDLMLELQGGGCAICGKTPEENGKRLFVDHDHKTGKVRELLCHRCNRVLGSIEDDPEMCEQLKLYLYKHGK